MFPFPTGFGGYGMPMGMGMGGPAFGMMPFEERYHAVPVAAADKSDTSKLEAGGKIILPPSALHKLTQLEIAYPMLFELTNQQNGRKLHCGVLEFIANEGHVLMPYWMMENLGLNHGGLVKVRSATLPKGTYVKLRPQTKNFLDIANPKAVLEHALRGFSALTKGETFRIVYNKKSYDIDVVDVKPRDHGAISIVDADVNVDFDAPADYVEPVRKPAAPLIPSFRSNEPPEEEQPLPSEKPKAFVGAAARPNGKAVDGMQVEKKENVPEKKSPLQWRLRFDRFDGEQPDHSAKAKGGGGGGDGFQAFKGSGMQLR